MAIFNGHFYHALVRKYTVAFGYLFNDMKVVRYNEAGQETKRIACPLTFAPKEKWLERIIADPKLDRKPAITLPRMAFEMVGMNYSPERKLNKNAKLYSRAPADGSVLGSYTPVPWDFEFNLYITTKTIEEMLQLVEQILPGFTPDYTIGIKEVTNASFAFDVPITLNSVQESDTYDSGVEEGRVIIWTLSFTMKGILFGPVRESALIKTAIVNVHDLESDNQYAQVTVVPFINGVPLEEINKLDPWSPLVTIEEIFP